MDFVGANLDDIPPGMRSLVQALQSGAVFGGGGGGAGFGWPEHEHDADEDDLPPLVDMEARGASEAGSSEHEEEEEEEEEGSDEELSSYGDSGEEVSSDGEGGDSGSGDSAESTSEPEDTEEGSAEGASSSATDSDGEEAAAPAPVAAAAAVPADDDPIEAVLQLFSAEAGGMLVPDGAGGLVAAEALLGPGLELQTFADGQGGEFVAAVVRRSHPAAARLRNAATGTAAPAGPPSAGSTAAAPHVAASAAASARGPAPPGLLPVRSLLATGLRLPWVAARMAVGLVLSPLRLLLRMTSWRPEPAWAPHVAAAASGGGAPSEATSLRPPLRRRVPLRHSAASEQGARRRGLDEARPSLEGLDEARPLTTLDEARPSLEGAGGGAAAWAELARVLRGLSSRARLPSPGRAPRAGTPDQCIHDVRGPH
jgi:hypothetical protein